MDEFINITSSVQQPKQKSVEQLLELINKNVNRKGTEQNKRLDIIEKDSTKILKAITKLNTRQEKAQTKKEKEKKDEETLRDKWNKFLDKTQGFFDKPADMLGEKFGLVGKALSAPLKLLSKSIGLLKRDDDTDGVKSQEESKEDAKEQKKESIWERFRAFVGEKLTLIGDKLSIKEKYEAAKEKLGNFGLIGKASKYLLNFIEWTFKHLGGLAKSLFKTLGVKGLAAIGAIIGVGMKAFEWYQNGILATAEKDKKEFLERWEKSDWLGMLMHPIDTISALAFMAGEKIGEGVIWLGNALSNLWEDLVDSVVDIKDSILDILPSWLGGNSKEEVEARKQKKARIAEYEKQGLSKREAKELEEKNAGRRAGNFAEMSVEEFKKNKAELAATLQRQAAMNTPEALEKRRAALVQKPTTQSSKPEKIEKPETPESDGSKREQPKAVEKTVIIKETQSGAEVADYIGTASSVVLNMTRT